MQNFNPHPGRMAYFNQRIAEAGMTPEEAAAYGLTPAPDGGININPRHLVTHTINGKEAHAGTAVYLPGARKERFNLHRLHPDTIQQKKDAVNTIIAELVQTPGPVVAYFLEYCSKEHEGIYNECRRLFSEHEESEQLAALFSLSPHSALIRKHKEVRTIVKEFLTARNCVTGSILHNLSNKNKVHKYDTPSKARSGMLMPVFPGLRSLQGGTGGTLTFTEGPLKGFTLEHAAPWCRVIAFNGNQFKLNDNLRSHLSQRRPDRVQLLLDGDYKAIKAALEGATWTTVRPQSFAFAGVQTCIKQLLEFKEATGISFDIELVAVRPDAPGKGIDDLLNAVPNKQEVVNELKTGTGSGAYFNRVTIRKSKYKDQVKQFFALKGHRPFHAYHAGTIQGDAFRFLGTTYKMTLSAGDLFKNPVPWFKVVQDPAAVPSLDRSELRVHQYLSEAAHAVLELLKQHGRVGMQAPTGSGKTSFFLHRSFPYRVVLAVPTKLQVEELTGSFHGVVGIHGHPTPAQLEAAANARAIVCTYEHLPRFASQGRVLVVDEAHNLVRQMGTREIPFRAETLRRLLACIQEAEQVVLISGTMPEMLVHALQLHLVNVRTEVRTPVAVRIVEATSDRKKAIRAALIAQLVQAQYRPGSPVVVLWNNAAELELIRQHIIKIGLLKPDQIATVTRAAVNGGEVEVFNGIARHSKIPDGVRLVLCTCLLAEGVNIKNKTIGNVYHVGRDALQAVQFAARARTVDRVNLVCILPPEREPLEPFGAPMHRRFNTMIAKADAVRPFLEAERRAQAAELVEHYPELAEHLNELEADAVPGLVEYTHLYIDALAGVRIDTLAILAELDQDVTRSANNAYFITKLLEHENFELVGIEGADVPEAITVQAAELELVQAEAEAEALEVVAVELAADPAPVVGCLLEHYRKTNRHQIEKLAPLATKEEQEGGDAVQVLALQAPGQAIGEHRAVRRLIRDFLNIRATGAAVDGLNASLHLWDAPQRRAWLHAWNKLSRLEAYANRRRRERLNIHDRTAAKIEHYIIEAVEAMPPGTHNAAAIYEAATAPLKVARWCEKRKEALSTNMAATTRTGVLSLVRAAFQVQTHNAIGEKRYTIGARRGTAALLEELEVLAGLEVCNNCTGTVCTFCNEKAGKAPPIKGKGKKRKTTKV